MEILKKFFKALKSLFETHPTVDQFHVTTNGQAFIQDNDAKNHAQTLPDKTVTLIKRTDVEAFNPDKAAAKKEADDKAAAENEAADKAAAEKETKPAKGENK